MATHSSILAPKFRGQTSLAGSWGLDYMTGHMTDQLTHSTSTRTVRRVTMELLLHCRKPGVHFLFAELTPLGSFLCVAR